MNALRHVGLGMLLLAVGWLAGGLWQQIITDAFQSTGAELITSSPSSAATDRAAYALVTGGALLLAAGIRLVLLKVAGRSLWPLWLLVVALLIGENLSVGLRLVALATITLPAAVGVAAATNAPPILDISQATIAPWALGGMMGAGVVALGMLTVMGLLGEEEA